TCNGCDLHVLATPPWRAWAEATIPKRSAGSALTAARRCAVILTPPEVDQDLADAQTRLLIEEAGRRGYRVVGDAIRGRVGATDASEEMRRLLELVDAGAVDAVLVGDPAAVVVDVEDWMRFLQRLARGDVRLVCVRETIDVSTSAARLVAGMLAV